MKTFVATISSLIIGSWISPNQLGVALNQLIDQGKFTELHAFISSTKDQCTRWRYRAIAAPYVDLLDSSLLEKPGIQKRCHIHDSIWLPGYAATLMNLNRSYSGYTSADILHRNKVARTLLGKCVDRFPHLEVCEDLMARWYETEGRNDSALLTIENALMKQGANPYFHALKGKYIYLLGDHASGYRILSIPTLCDNHSPYQGRACFEAKQIIGRVHYQTGQPDSSLDDFRVARLYREWSPSLDFELGCAWLRKENLDSACHYLTGTTMVPDIRAMDSLKMYCQDRLPP